MKAHSPSRRRTLQQLLGLTALGAINALRLPRALAAGQAERLSIPGITGKIIRRQDPDYELWRQSMVWHMSKPKRYPDLMVQAKSDSDVIEAVKYAAGNHMQVAMRAGGHNSTGSALRDGGLLIDMSAMGGIEIDESRQIASIQPGVRSLDLITAAGQKGLSFPVPHCPSVGLAGFTLGGGIGWNYPQRGGVSTFSIAGADVVTADGRQLHATPDENPDLYWSLRGAGPGFFGAVTRLELALYPAPKAILASSYIFPLSELETVTATLDTIRKQHDVTRVELLAVLMHHPDAPADAPAEQSKICFFTAFAFEASEQEARQALAPFAQSELGTKCLVKMENQPFDFAGLYERYFSLRDPAGRCARYAVDNVLTNRGGQTLQALAQYFLAAPTRDTHILAAFNMHTRTRPDSCFSWDIDCYLGCYTIWDNEADDERVFTWLDGTLPLMDPFAEGHYVNEVEGRRHPDRYRLSYSETNWQRLRHMRQQFDPTGVFQDYLGSS